jgi:hypothetical protein
VRLRLVGAAVQRVEHVGLLVQHLRTRETKKCNKTQR